MKQQVHNILVIAKESEPLASLHSELNERGFDCSVSSYQEEIIERIVEQPPDVVIVEVNGYIPPLVMYKFISRIKQEGEVPVLALVTGGIFEGIEDSENIDDILMSPYKISELELRVRRLLQRKVTADEIVERDGLKIDLARCEVLVVGKKIDLTFKEYELLKLLAGNPGRVYTREALLDKVWGLDYYGGDRTVDVHIRRLRSKLDNSRHGFIETVRNIGYRFRSDV